MLQKMVVSFAVVLIAAANASATVVEIPLPELLGSYRNTVRTTTIVLPALPSAIHGASFRVSGTTVIGQADCPEEGGVHPFPMDLWAYMIADGPANLWGAWNHSEMGVTGPFSWTAPFRGLPQSTTWSFLMDGVADLTLSGHDPSTWCDVLSSPSAIITEAVFIIDADFPVAVEPSTWGKIKALYR